MTQASSLNVNFKDHEQNRDVPIGGDTSPYKFSLHDHTYLQKGHPQHSTFGTTKSPYLEISFH